MPRINGSPRAVCVAVLCTFLASVAPADTFGTGENQFTIDFVTISGDTNPLGGQGIVENDYRIGVYEITNDQWDKFVASLEVPLMGSPPEAYARGSYYTGANIPVNRVSWVEAAQFVNWLNTSTDHLPAYRFTGVQGTSGYTFATWSPAEAAGGNLYRHKDAFYHLPGRPEWVKAAYWNGTSSQTYATKPGESLQQGDGVSGSGWNYRDGEFATDPPGPWAVGSGSEELNGTHDMMGNLFEWLDTPYSDTSYAVDSHRGMRGGTFATSSSAFGSYTWWGGLPFFDIAGDRGIRVASEIPEPASLALLTLGALALLRRKRR